MSTASNPFDKITTCDEAMDLAVQIHTVNKEEDKLLFAFSIFAFYLTIPIPPIKISKTELGNIVNSGDCLTQCVVFKAYKDKANNNLKLPHIVAQLSNRLIGSTFKNCAAADEIESTYSIALLKYIYNNMPDGGELHLYKAIIGINSDDTYKYRLHLYCEGVLTGIFNFCENGPFFLPIDNFLSILLNK